MIFLLLLLEYWDYYCVPSISGLCGAGVGTQGFAHARQALYQLSYLPSPAIP